MLDRIIVKNCVAKAKKITEDAIKYNTESQYINAIKSLKQLMAEVNSYACNNNRFYEQLREIERFIDVCSHNLALVNLKQDEQFVGKKLNNNPYPSTHKRQDQYISEQIQEFVPAYNKNDMDF